MIEVRDTFDEVLEVDADGLVSLVFDEASDFWNGPTGVASAHCKAGENKGAELYLYSKNGTRLALRYHDAECQDVLMLKAGDDEREGKVTLYPGGDEWKVPHMFFVSRQTALEAIRHFFQTGGCNDDNWLSLSECGSLGEG